MRLEYENCSRIKCYLDERELEWILFGFRLDVDEGFEFDRIVSRRNNCKKLETKLVDRDLILKVPRSLGKKVLEKELGKVIEGDGSFKYGLILLEN